MVWEIVPTGSGNEANLTAYAAVPVDGTLPELWTASIGNAAKFSMPLPHGQRVYVGNGDGQILAFGPVTTAPPLSGEAVAGARHRPRRQLTSDCHLYRIGHGDGHRHIDQHLYPGCDWSLHDRSPRIISAAQLRKPALCPGELCSSGPRRTRRDLDLDN